MQERNQNHPLYISDRPIVNRLLSVLDPASQDIVDCSRLFIRYDHFPGAMDLQEDLAQVLKNWGFNREELNKKARSIWTGGYRPRTEEDVEVGSGADITTT